MALLRLISKQAQAREGGAKAEAISLSLLRLDLVIPIMRCHHARSMASTPQRLLAACEALHAQNRRLAAARSHVVVFAAGAGASGVAALLGAPGASATLLEARTPYSRAAFDAAAAEAGAEYTDDEPKEVVPVHPSR